MSEGGGLLWATGRTAPVKSAVAACGQPDGQASDGAQKCRDHRAGDGRLLQRPEGVQQTQDRESRKRRIARGLHLG